MATQKKQQVATQDPPAEKEQGTQVTVRPIDKFKTQLVTVRPTVAPMLPPHVTWEKFTGMVVSAVMRNPALLDCDRSSLLQAVADTADMGLSLNPNMKEADILPVNKGQGKIAQMRPRAIGLMKLALQSDVVTKIWAHVVYENDDFWYALGLNKDLRHQPLMDDSQRGAMLQQAYCCWETKDGVRDFELIGPKRIARAREASQGFQAFKSNKIKSTPWSTDEEEMIRKTAVIAASKYMPKSSDSDKFQKAVAMATDVDFTPVDPHETQTALPPKEKPPRPTRQQTRKQKDDAEKAQREMDAQYRQTMGGHMGDKPPMADEHGVVIDNDPQDKTGKPEPDKGKAKPTQQKKAETKAPDYTALHAEITSLLVKATGMATINAISERYGEEINAMQVEAPDLYQTIQEGLAGKRQAFSKKG